MKLTEKTIVINFHKDAGLGNTLDISGKNLNTLINLGEIVKLQEINILNCNFNYLKSIEDIFNRGFLYLRELNLSVNHIKNIDNLHTLRNLERLNLSTNRINKIENLEKLKNLIFLDLSQNYIEKIENLNLGKLNELYLNGNQIKYIENLEKLPMLTKLNLSKNKIESLGSLGIPPKNTSIEILDLSRNLFSIDCLENLIFELQNIRDLKEIDFTDNEITKNKDYKPKILVFKEIIRLDGLETKGILRNHLELLKTTNNYETLIEKTKKETLENLRENEELKRRLNEKIDEKEEEIDRIYEKYELTMKNDLDEFIDFMFDFEKHRDESDPKILEKWSSKLQIAQNERLRMISQNEYNYNKTHQKYVDSQLKYFKMEPINYKPTYYKPDIIENISIKNDINEEELSDSFPLHHKSILTRQNLDLLEKAYTNKENETLKIPLKDNIQLKSESNSHNSQQNRVRSPKYKDLRISTQGHIENPRKNKENEIQSQQFKENRAATHSVIESIDRENKKKRNSNDSNKLSKRSEFIKDDKLKEKLDKFAKSHLEKEDSVISNDKNSKNNVDWKLKRKEFMERKKTKKLEEENIIKITEIPIKKNKKTRWCTIF